MGGEGSVRAEIFAVRLTPDGPMWLKPDDGPTWCIAVDPRTDPFEAVRETIRACVSSPVVLHSTSWRHEDASLILTFLAVVEDGVTSAELRWTPVRRARLARGEPNEPPDELASTQVLEHAMRHLAWLAADDDEIRRALPAGWEGVLAAYEPQPFRQLSS
jgi:hypothetical protein